MRKGIWNRLYSPGTGLLILRIVVGIIFISHGWAKLADMSATVEFFGKFGIPAFMAWLVALGEFGGGISLILGLFSRIMGWVISAIMVGALLIVIIPNGGLSGGELEATLLASGLAIALAGPGKWAFGPRICKCCKSGKCDPDGGCSCHYYCDTMNCGNSCHCGSGENCGCSHCSSGMPKCDNCDDCKDKCSLHEHKKNY